MSLRPVVPPPPPPTQPQENFAVVVYGATSNYLDSTLETMYTFATDFAESTTRHTAETHQTIQQTLGEYQIIRKLAGVGIIILIILIFRVMLRIWNRI